MEKGSLAIRNQKVFIRLSRVAELQENYSKLCSEISVQNKIGAIRENPEQWKRNLTRKAVYDSIIRTLELPIPEQRC